ncbi:hypothetical protein GEOBC_01711 [Geobacteraceae bacterium]|nr:hypothetical protein GEOBC_01711 [Geobacteraceae bacterium]
MKTVDAIVTLKYSVPQCIHNNPKGNVMLKEDVGAAVYKTWNSAQRREEIAKLVQGYRSGLPASMLCKISESIAGNRKRARKYLQEMMTPDERQVAVDSESGDMMAFVRGYLL